MLGSVNRTVSLRCTDGGALHASAFWMLLHVCVYVKDLVTVETIIRDSYLLPVACPCMESTCVYLMG